MQESAHFCPECFEPDPHYDEQLRIQSEATGISYQRLLDRAWINESIKTSNSESLDSIDARLVSMDERIEHLERVTGMDPEKVEFDKPDPEFDPLLPTTTSTPGLEEIEQASFESADYVEQETDFSTPSGIDLAEPPTSEAHQNATFSDLDQQTFAAPEYETPPIRTKVSLVGTPKLTDTDIEDLLSGRVLAWVGGLANLLGAVFFLSMAFSRGWISPGIRVITGVVISSLMIVEGGWFFERRERVFGHVLVAVGLGRQ